MDLGDTYRAGDIVSKWGCGSMFVIVDLQISSYQQIYKGSMICIKSNLGGLNNYEKISFLMFAHDFKWLYALVSA